MLTLLSSAAALFVTLGAAAPPGAGLDALFKTLPRLKGVSPAEVQRVWSRLKETPSLASQLRALKKKQVEAMWAKDLINVRTLAGTGQPLAGVGFRDNVRQRGWARPTMALLLADSLAQLQRDFPGKTITIGDVAQPGGGQINHGVIVKMLEGDAAKAFAQIAVMQRGHPTTLRLTTPAEYPAEADRFETPWQRVRVVNTARAQDKGKGPPRTLRVAETRYTAATIDPTQLRELEETFAKMAKRNLQVAADKVSDYRGDLALWHFVNPREGFQMEVLGRGRPNRSVVFGDVVEIRFARWQDKKIGSFPSEILWVREDSGWTRWFQLNEAGHISHLSGIDADLSYITKENGSHFAVDLEAMDVPATWRWFELLDETARRMKVPVEAILVDRVIRDHLRANLPMKGKGSVARHRLWGIIKVSGGHDGHHHLRIHEGSAKQEKAALKALSGR